MPGLCDKAVPPLAEVADSHRAACFLYPEVLAAAGIGREVAHAG
jgi:peptide/nickel transport system ATP-binding protein